MSFKFIILLAVAVPGLVYLILAIRESMRDQSVSRFLPLSRSINQHSLMATTVSAGMSMATVMVALINLGPILRYSLFVLLLTYIAGYIVVFFLIDRIRKSNRSNTSLQQFLGDTFKSVALRRTAAFCSLLGYIGIFGMELIVGAALFEPFFGKWILLLAGAYFVFLMLYVGIAGFRSVVATDRIQLVLIMIGIGALAFFGVGQMRSGGLGFESLGPLASPLPLGFLLGAIALNTFGLTVDAGMWQRICSANTLQNSKIGIRRSAYLVTTVWSILIIVGIVATGWPAIESLSGQEGAATDLLPKILQSMGEHSMISAVLLLALVIGLFSAMIGTADSLLITATHIVVDFRQDLSGSANRELSLMTVRILLVSCGIAGFGLFLFFYLLEFNVVQLIFALYGAQLALWPVTIYALTRSNPKKMTGVRVGAIWSVIAGYAAAWAMAIWGQISVNVDVQFLAPVAGLGTSCTIFFVAILYQWMNRKPHTAGGTR